MDLALQPGHRLAIECRSDDALARCGKLQRRRSLDLICTTECNR
jgi:hypothetical protein